jgi:hypothetical protein
MLAHQSSLPRTLHSLVGVRTRGLGEVIRMTGRKLVLLD